jgi:hypothetical protein
MARTLEELDRELAAVREDVDLLKRGEAATGNHLRGFAGCFTGDDDWTAIHEEVEERRRQPDPDLSGS